MMERIASRDVAAFECLYRDHHRALSRFLLNLTRSPALADEVLNDTMMAVWNKPEGFRGDSRLSTWIFAIAWRQAMRALRRQDQPLPDPEDDDSRAEAGQSVSPGPDAFARRRIGEAMQALSVDHRTVIDLTYFHELSCREIAEIMDCPVDTVKTRMFHARRHLKRLLPGGPGDWI